MNDHDLSLFYDHSWFINHSHYLWSLFYDHLISWFSRLFHFSKTPSRPPFPLWHSLPGKVSVSRILSRWRACWTSRCCFKAASGGEWKRWENVSGNQRSHHEIYRDRGSPWSWKLVPSSNPVVRDIFLDELYVILSFKLFLVSIWTIFKQNHMNSMGFLWNDFSLLGWLQA